jgi:hypothetical protein
MKQFKNREDYDGIIGIDLGTSYSSVGVLKIIIIQLL